MPDFWIAIISVVIGAILGFLSSFLSSIAVIKKQEKSFAKGEFRKFLVDLIVKITQNEHLKTTRLWETLQNYYPVSDMAIDNVLIHLSKSDRENITNAYEHYKNPNPATNSNAYDIVEEKAKMLAISNIKKILEIVK